MGYKNTCNIDGTSLMGYVTCTYDDLVKVFGPPNTGPNSNIGDKVTCEWCLTFDCGTPAFIYDWKMNSTPTYMYDWHIGGLSSRSVDLVVKEIAKFVQIVKLL